MSALPTSSVLTRVLGFASLAGAALLVWMGLVVTPADVVQGEHVRLVYIHPAVAWTAYLGVGTAALASALYLYPRTRSRFWDLLAGASAEIGALFCALTLVTGAIWGRPTWGVWWAWDPRLTSSALLLAILIGYIALRQSSPPSDSRAKRCAVTALIAAADVPIVHMSVEWWRTLHQDRTLLRPDPTIEGLQLVTMLLGIAVMTLIFSWMVVHRFRIEKRAAATQERTLEDAIAERRAEAGVSR